ncbi:MAG: hypothetical protein AB7P03_17015 [Kofleriaceae bacterium]
MIRALVAVLALSACSSAPPSNPKAAPTSDDRNSCESADDCVLVEACCGCSGGGRRVAIRKDAVTDYDATRAKRCADSTCTMAISTHPSCDAEAICDQGHCRVAPHLGKASASP